MRIFNLKQTWFLCDYKVAILSRGSFLAGNDRPALREHGGHQIFPSSGLFSSLAGSTEGR